MFRSSIFTCGALLAVALLGGKNVSAAPASDDEKFEVIIAGGKIVDGTGAPWYIADIGIRDGRIARIGRLVGEGIEGKTKVIRADGLIVAPGLVDMMGQSAEALLDDPKAALNMLSQGITTINAGEGHSPAPVSDADARSLGWSTMAEYFQLLELRGLPLNVAQTVGHTQVRRRVLGDVDRKPTPDELEQMRGYVREAMEAGAIGMSTALIYPPAVYADTDEIGALAAVAGAYGGRYYTHMRNEGDQLLEAIDEALEIGRKGKTPVHIFHLKAAGRANWSKMDEAIAKIAAARAAGEQVAADIYPYVNNGLGIAAMIHPRHFANGRADLIARLDDAALRGEIQNEMEADGGDWENWFKHIGRDWNKLVVGRSNSLRLRAHAGKTLAEIATLTNTPPWELFFELVKTDAFVLPESMSEANKVKLIQQEFVSFCTDVGPFGGESGASHPRGFGAFPRLLSKYIRDGGAVSLERVIAQASAHACNEVLAYDRGRIAEGLAADIIVFDYETIEDRATFAQPYEIATGMRHVLVNGEPVLDGKGQLTGKLPGKVLRGPGWNSTRPMTGPDPAARLEGLDQLVQDFMDRHHIPGAALALTDRGSLVYARGFGYADIAARTPVSPRSLFRIASISKPVTATAIFKLIESGKLNLDDKVFDILTGYEPADAEATIEPRLRDITILQLLQHSGGWDRDVSFDAMFKSVPFAEKLGTPPPAGPDVIIRNMLTQPLDFDPGTRYAYSNFGYCLLGRVIEKLTGSGYEAFVKSNVLDPAGARTMVLGRSMPEQRLTNEVRYYSPYRGPSVFAASLGKRVPYPYGGWNLEAMDSHGAWLASVLDLAQFASSFYDPNHSPILSKASIEQMQKRPSGGPELDSKGEPKRRVYAAGWGREEPSREGDSPAFSHSGSLAGTSTLLKRRGDGRSWIILFNARSGPTSDFFPGTLQPEVDGFLDQISADDWQHIREVTGDLFQSFPNHQSVGS
ncbi:MAG: serine hydrolase [Verrucomicrobiales bacterium]